MKPMIAIRSKQGSHLAASRPGGPILYSLAHSGMQAIPAAPHRPRVCPHDCPSACTLEVEGIDGCGIGRIRGAPVSYMQGVVGALLVLGLLIGA
jgi:hypothetical protein